MDVTFNFVMAILVFSLPYIFTLCNLFTISKTVSCNQHQANVVPSFPEYNGTLTYLEFKGQWIIRDLDYNSFKNAPLSKQLILQNIGLKRLSCDVFNNIIPELQILNLDDNLLDYFPACSVNTLWRLRTLTLSRNFIQCIPEHSIPGLLTYLDVSNNKIYSLGSDLSTDVHNKNQLKTLIVRGNNLRRINENELYQFSSLKYLDASENQLDYINSVSFLSSGPQLRDINLSHNQLAGTVWLCLEHTLEVRNLNLSHNLIELVNDTTLSNMKSLQKLDISYNILASVGPAFVDQKDILLLLFQHNAITSVSRELFSTRSRFMESFTIDLSFNSLASVDLGILECFNCKVSVHHNKLKTMSIASNRNSTFSLIDISFNSLETLPQDLPPWKNFNGSHNPFSTTSVIELFADFPGRPVHSVNLQNTTFLCKQSENIPDIHISSELSLHLEDNCIPSGFICRLKAMVLPVHIYLDRNGIKTLHECALNVSIATLSLKGNYLTYLNESFITQEMPDLVYLDIAENKLVSIDVPRLVTNTVLYLNMSMNNIQQLPTIRIYDYHFQDKEIRFDLSSSNISRLPAFEFENYYVEQSYSVIDISNNNLKHIPPIIFNQSFYMYRSILLFNASDNLIQSVFNVFNMPSGYNGSNNRFILDFSRNHITSVTNMIILNCRHLFYMYPPSVITCNMTANMLTSFPTCDFLDCFYGNLLLDFSHNFLRTLPHNESCVMNQVLTLNVSHNMFTEISSPIAYSVTLQYLIMNSNKISTMTPHAFTRLYYLKELDLSFNNLEVFPEAIKRLFYLEKLNLAGNIIFTVPDSDLSFWSSLSLIQLYGNPLICSCSTAWLRHYTLHADLGQCRYPPELEGNSVSCLAIASCDASSAVYSSKKNIQACYGKGIVFKHVGQTLKWNISSHHVQVTAQSRVDVSVVRKCKMINIFSSLATNASTFPDNVGESGEEICLTLSDKTWISNFTECLVLNRTGTNLSLTPALPCVFTQASDNAGYIGAIIALSVLLVIETFTGIVLYIVHRRRQTVARSEAAVTSTSEQAVYENPSVGETSFSGSYENRASSHYYEAFQSANK